MNWFSGARLTASKADTLQPWEQWLDVVANIGIVCMCIVMLWFLLDTWKKIDQQQYPRWTLLAIGSIYTAYTIHRILNIGVLVFPAWRILLYWDVATFFIVIFGMWGQIILAKWVGVNTFILRREIVALTDRHKEYEIKLIDEKAKTILLEAKLMACSSLNPPVEELKCS